MMIILHFFLALFFAVIVALIFGLRKSKKELNVTDSLQIPTKPPKNLKNGNIWIE